MPRLLRWICLFLLPLASLAQAPVDFQLAGIVGTPLDYPQDIVVNAQGQLYVLDRGHVTVLDAQGRYVRRIDFTGPDPTKYYKNNQSLSLDAAGNLYTTDFLAAEVRKFSPNGRLLLSFSQKGTQPGSLDAPRNVTADAAGNTYVVDGSPRVQQFDPQGRFQWAFVAPSPAGSPPLVPRDVAVDPAGSVYVLESDLSVFKLSSQGQPTAAPLQLPAAPFPTDATTRLSLDPAGNLCVGVSGGIRRFDPAGRLLGYPGHSNSTIGATSFAFDATGNLYVTDQPNGSNKSRLYKFDVDAQRVGEWGNLTPFEGVVQDGLGNFFIYSNYTIRKYGPAGEPLFWFGFSGPGKFERPVVSLAVDLSNNIYTLESDYTGSRLQKFSSTGQFLSVIENADLSRAPAQSGLAVDPAGNLYLADPEQHLVRKLDPQGRQLLRFGSYGSAPGQFQQPLQVATDGRGDVYVADINGHRVQKFNSTGRFLWTNDISRTSGFVNAYPRIRAGLSVDAAGTVFLSSFYTLDDKVRVYEPSGQLSRTLDFGADNLAINRNGTRLLTLISGTDLVNIYTTTAASVRTREAQITGRIFQDSNQDCTAQTSLPLPGIVVVAEPGSYYGLSDENGNYTISADTGRYTVRQLLPTNEPGRVLTPTCATQPAVHLAAYDTSVPGPDFGNQVSVAPYLRVEVGSNRRRRCFRNLTSVRYANTGFATARAAQVAVKLPEQVVLISASAPYTRDARGNYLFAVGDLAPQQSGQISITDSVVCGNPAIRGLTVCTQAWITPANASRPPAAWNGSAVAVRGKATPDGQVRFALVNQGRRATGDSLGLRVFNDAKLALNKKYALAAGDSLVLRVPAGAGQALRLEADQPASYPLGLTASATVEAAGSRPGGLPNPAILMLPPAPTPPTVAEDCQPIIDSFDPNDKQVLPTGTGPAHDTPTGTALRYQLRFQNTGTDVAYRVEVVDTLSADLDLRTLRVGAASHPYRLRVAGKVRPVLTFTFDGINLPERSRNEAASNGFVQFSIRPKAALAPKTRIANFADIFFDYNEPVRTNTTVNQLYDAPPVVDLAIALQLNDVIVSPQLTSFAPAQGPAGTLVTLSGQHFATAAGANQVSFNGVAAPVLSAAPGQLTVQVPAGAASGRIQVVTAEGGAHSSTDFQVGQATPTALAAPDAALTLYPNPAPGGAATLAWRGADFAVRQVRVFDSRGARLLELRPGSAVSSLPLPLVGKAPGLYLVLIETSRGLVRKRLTVQ